MDEPLIAIAVDAEADYALLAIGMAWVAILGMLAAGVVADAWRRVRALQAALMDEAVTRCLKCAARPLCETGALPGLLGSRPATCPNVERLRRAP